MSSPCKMVWSALIISCCKKLIDLLTELYTIYHLWLLFNILYTSCNFQKTLKAIKW